MSEAPRIVSNVSVWPFEAAKAIIQEHIAHMKPEDVCALIIFEIRFSPDMPEKTTDGVRHRMEQVLSGSMKPSNLLARMDDDMFLVVDFNPESAERVLAKMRDMRGAGWTQWPEPFRTRISMSVWERRLPAVRC